LGKQYQRVGFDENQSDPLLLKFHRANVIRWACNVDYEKCFTTSGTLFASWMNNSHPDNDNPVPTNFRRTVYCTAVRRGGEKEWNFLWKRYLKSNVASDKTTMLIALGCSKDPWILNRYLSWATSDGNGIRKQDGPIALRAVASQEVGSYVAFNFLREKWLDMRKYFGTGFFGISGVITTVASRLSSHFELQELENFRERYKNHLGSAKRVLDQACESVQANVNWMEDNYPTISLWLESQVPPNQNDGTEMTNDYYPPTSQSPTVSSPKD